MKKTLFIAAMAIVALVSCSENEYVGVSNNSPNSIDGAIVFNPGANVVTRADKTGAEAAEALNYAFVVGGFKGASSVATTTVFDNYNVRYTANTADATESNSSNWEYVGLQPNALATIPHTSSDVQTIKYWDYSQDQYDFIAYSLGTGGATATTITPATATSSTGGAYTISGTTAQLGTVHIADLVTVLNADYNKVVNLTFRNMVSKVRVALYETVPGYSVKDVKFYSSDAAISGGSTSANAVLYAASSVLPTEGIYTIYFPTVNDGTPATDKNKAHVAFTTSTSVQSSQDFGILAADKLVTMEKNEYTENDDKDNADFLGRTSDHATYAGLAANNYYVDVLPLEGGTSLTLKVDYTLMSTDGTGETIKVVGAKAVVPSYYAQWKPGYAYTYIFKISDNTNGYTSGVESQKLSGLHPITLDALVETAINEKIQETVTTVATPSITTYQHVPAVNASANNEYKAGTVYAMVMDNSTSSATLKTDLASKTALYSLSKANATEAEVMDALIKQASINTTTITGRNGIGLTELTSNIDNTIVAIPGADGNNITVTAGTVSQLTVAANTTYAYVYTVTAPSGDPTVKYEVVPVTVNVTDVNGYYTRTGAGTNEDPYVYNVINTDGEKAAQGTTYYEKYSVYNGEYAVKVIKVASGS